MRGSHPRDATVMRLHRESVAGHVLVYGQLQPWELGPSRDLGCTVPVRQSSSSPALSSVLDGHPIALPAPWEG